MPIPNCFHYYSSIVELKVRNDVASRSFIVFIVQDCFSYPGFFVFHMKLSIVLSRFVKNCVWILMVIALKL